jgi:hypothetical protein
MIRQSHTIISSYNERHERNGRINSLTTTSGRLWQLYNVNICNAYEFWNIWRSYAFRRGSIFFLKFYWDPLPEGWCSNFFKGGVYPKYSLQPRENHKSIFLNFQTVQFFELFQFSRTPPHKTLHEFRRHMGTPKTDTWKKCNSKNNSVIPPI